MRTEQELETLLKQLDAERRAAENDEMSFTGLESEQIAAFRLSTELEIASVSWNTYTAPGSSLQCRIQVANPTANIRTQLTLTSFVGPASLAPSFQEMIAWRDSSWPMLSCKSFQVEPKAVERLVMPAIPAPSTAAPAIYVVNFLLWEQNLYSVPAKIWSRKHIRFEVKR